VDESGPVDFSRLRSGSPQQAGEGGRRTMDPVDLSGSVLDRLSEKMIR
jgi:hypothetical protein